MAKQLNVNLAFTADTGKARQQLQELQRLLSGLTTKSAQKSPLGITTEINEAIADVSKLEVALKSATTNTGSLDLGQFKREIDKAGLSAEKIADRLATLGPEGKQAFAQLTQAVVTAEVPLKRTSTLLSNFATTLKNTARWQISSSILHGFMGSLQKAYGYAEDLNESLNNIRIVTGQSADQMADFAQEANKAAKELSTTTTAYTDAALIFYQQGLTGEDVTDRTDTVIKLANVTGQSAEDVSSYMTAIWNNFYDGSTSLEHFADVITNLGAHTASSSREIAEGLEKFAAVGQTVGLSYDYATSALATVVAQTRQSADVVGNAFKTLFARLQGLQLGETLDDGTDLTKYSKALAAVGIQIKDEQGELKDMNSILDEMGAKWQQLAKDEQVALAQTVAGVRQYTQLVALMDNWGKFQENLGYAKSSDGTLQEQADIYAESWEAASKRVTAAAQEIYTQLLDDDFFIDLLNSLEKIINTISNVIDAFGGLKGLIPLIGSLMLKAFGSDLANSINNIKTNILSLSSAGREAIIQERMAMVNALKGITDDSTFQGSAQTDAFKIQADLQEQLIRKSVEIESINGRISESEQEQIKNLMDINTQLSNAYINAAKQRDEQEDIAGAIQRQMQQKVGRNNTDFSNLAQKANNFQQQYIVGDKVAQQYSKVKIDDSSWKEVQKSLIALKENFDATGTAYDKFVRQLEGAIQADSLNSFKDALGDLDQRLEKIGSDAYGVYGKIESLLVNEGMSAEQAASLVQKLQIAHEKAAQAAYDESQGLDNLKKNTDSTSQAIGKLAAEQASLGTIIVTTAQGLASFAMVLSSIKGISDTLNDDNLSPWEKFVTILGTAGMMIPMLASSIKSLSGIILTSAGSSTADAVAKEAETIATEEATAAQLGLNVAMEANPIGLVILAITALIGIIVGAVAIYDKFTMSVEEANEVLEDFNTKQKEVQANKISLENNINELQQMQDEYEKLSQRAGQYDKNIETLTEEEQRRYEEIKKKIADCNDEAVAYYDNQGRLILKHNEDLDDTIAKLKEQIELEQAAQYTENYEDTKKAHDVKYEAAQTDYQDAQDNYRVTEEDIINNVKDIKNNIENTINSVGANTEETFIALQELTDIINQGPEAILKAKEQGKFKNYYNILAQALEDAGYEKQSENIQQYLNGIVSSAENFKNQVEDASDKIEEARIKAEAATKIDLNWVLGVIKYVSEDNNNEGYTLLKNKGIENAESYVAAYVDGLVLGSSTDLEGNLIQNYDDVLKAVNLYEKELFKEFEKGTISEKDFNELSKDWSNETFTSYQDYVNKLVDKINTFIKDNPGFAHLDEKVKEALLQSVYGTGNIDFGADDLVKKIDTEYTEAFSNFRKGLFDKINQGGTKLIDINSFELREIIPADQLDNLDYIIDNIDIATARTEGWQTAVQQVLDSLNQIEQIDIASVMNDATKSVMQGLQSGDLTLDNILDNEDYQAIINNLDKLKEQYPELTSAAEVLNKTWLVGTQEYLEALELVQDKMSNVKINNLQEQAKKASDEFKDLFKLGADGTVIDIKADPDEFQTTLDNLLNAEYSIDVEIHAEAEQEFDSISAAMDDIAEKAAIVGEKYVVAATDLRELNNTFPGIIEGMEVLKDGTVQLNEEIVQSAMKAAEDEVKADAKATVEKLHNQATLLRAKQTSYENMANAALILAKSEEHTDAECANARASISAELANLQELNSKEATDSTNKNAKEVADASEENGEAVAKNWESAFQALADASYQAASAAIANMNAVESGGEATEKKISVQYKGTSGVDKDASIIQKTKDSLSEDNEQETDWAAMAEAYAQMADQAGAAANDIEGMIAQIGAAATDVDKKFSNVAKGLGANPKDVKGSKRDKTDQKDLINDEIDRYWDINNAISKINQELERTEQLEKKISTYQQHYAGKTLIKSLQKENALLKEKNGILDKQYQNYQKLYEIQSQELGELKGKIGGNWNGNELQNYAELFQANVDKYNAVISAYNAMTKEQQDASGKQMIEDAKRAYDTYKDALERYQTLYYNEMYDTENKLAEYRQQQLENQFKIIENNLKVWETEIQIKLDMTGLKRDWKAFMKEVETDFRKIYKDLTKASNFDIDIFGTHIEDAETRIKQIEDVEAEIRKMEASKDANGVVQISDDMMFGSISEAQEKLKELSKELIDVGNSLNDMYKQVWDNYIDGLDQAKDNFEDINDEIEHLTKELEYEKELIELIYGDKAYELMDKYYTTQQKNIENQIGSIQQQAQFWEEQFEKAFEMNKDKHNVNRDDMSTWTEDMRKAYDNMIEAQEKLNDLVIEGIQNLRDEYLNNIAKTLSEMDKAMWGMDFDKVKEDWDFIQKRADEYLDDVEGAYKIQSLQNKINKGIADADSLKAQQKLAKLRDDEMKMLREKERLTQDDIDLAEARYQIALKEIALEDAQNNKTSMKLSRDTSGNWTYQYVADEEDTQNKQQELLDAYANLYETADNAYNHAMELAMQMYEEYQEKFRQISEDTTLSEEEKYLKLMELQDLYLPEIEAAFENAQIYQQEVIYATAGVFQEVCDQDEAAYDYLTQVQKDLVDSVRDHHLEDYEEIRAAIVDEVYPELKQAAEDTFLETNENSHTAAAQVIDDWDKGSDSVKAALNDAFKAVIGYTKDFEKELELLEQISKKNITDPNGIVSDIEAIGNKMDEAASKIDEMADRAENDLDILRDAVNQVEDAWASMIDRIQEAINALQDYLQATEEAINAQRELAQAAAEARSAGADSPSFSGGGGSGNSSSGGGSNQEVAGEKRESSDTGRNYKVKVVSEGSGKVQIIHDKTLKEAQAIVDGGKNDPYAKYYIEHYATGGYTGSWDDQTGRLAVLHQKELVLNATDTENMLAAVNTIRDLSGLNESISQTIASSIGSLIVKAISAGGVSNINTTTSNDNSNNNVFHISAEFPNANDVQTIKDAILSLPNIASQYIHTN